MLKNTNDPYIFIFYFNLVVNVLKIQYYYIVITTMLMSPEQTRENNISLKYNDRGY